MVDGHELGDHPAHRHADDVRGRQLEVVQQADRVLRHVVQRVCRALGAAPQQLPPRGDDRAAQVRGAPDVAIVEADDEEAARGELLAELLVPEQHLRRQAHDEQQRRGVRRAEGLVAELDAVAHGGTLSTAPLHKGSHGYRAVKPPSTA